MTEPKEYIMVRDGVRYLGAHLHIDLFGAKRLDEPEHIEAALRASAAAAGATLLHTHLHPFETNGGVAGIALLAESHISIHSWPEYSSALLDVFMCGSADPHRAVEVMRAAFEPRRMVVKEHLRGKGV